MGDSRSDQVHLLTVKAAASALPATLIIIIMDMVVPKNE